MALWVTTSLDLIGQMATPLMLITMGVAVAMLILQVSTAVVVTQYMLAAKYGGEAEAVATLPLTLAFLI